MSLLYSPQESTAQVGTIAPPISDANQPAPTTVPGVTALRQDLSGPIETSSYTTRGFKTVAPTNPGGNDANTSTVEVNLLSVLNFLMPCKMMF